MHYIKGLFDFSELGDLIKSNDSWILSSDKMNKLLSVKLNENTISILGCKFDPSMLVSQFANPEDIQKSLSYSMDKLDVKKLLIIFINIILFEEKCAYENRLIETYIENSIGKKIFDNKENLLKIDIDETTSMSNIIEPKFIRLLQLSYWIYVNFKLDNNTSFENKLNNVSEELNVTSNQEDLLINKILNVDQNDITTIQNINKQIESIYCKISSCLPEFMISGLLKMEHYNVNFIPKSNIEKRCDLCIDNINIEIKTIHDNAIHTLELEEDLEKEIWRTIDRIKIKKDKDALEKRADIIILFLSYTSVGNQMLKHTHKVNYDDDYSFSKIVINAIDMHKKQKDDEIPLIVFANGILSNNKYSYAMFSYLIALPIVAGSKNMEINEIRLKKFCNYK